MSFEDWRRVGPVTVTTPFEPSVTFPTLREALVYLGHRRLAARHVAVSPSDWPVGRMPERPFRVLDEHGFDVPEWLLGRLVVDLRLDARPCRRDHHPHVHRSGPVPGVGGRRGSYYDWLRRPATLQEIRENAAVDHDPEVDGVRIVSRARRRAIPTFWDDRVRHTERSWKRHRRSRWRD